MIMQKIYLILKEVFSSKFISLIVFFSVIVSVISAGLFDMIGNGFTNYIRNKFAASIPPNTIKVSPKPPKTLLFFRIKNRGTPVLDDRKIRRIKKIRGVKVIYPVMLAKVPVQAKISLFGLKYSTDMLCVGAPYRLVYRDIKSRRLRRLWLKPDFEKNIPVLFPGILLRAYNEGMAEPNMLPRISKKGIIGLKFQIYFGTSSLRRFDDHVEVDAALAGFTDKINSLAMVVPLSVSKYYNKKFDPEGWSNEYLYAFVKVKDHKALLKASAMIKKMGFIVETEKRLSREILKLKKNVDFLISGLMYLILFLSALTISFSTMIATMNRVEYFRIMRMLGASKTFIAFTIFFKYSIIGMIGSYAGMMLIEFGGQNITDLINVSIIKISLTVSKELGKKILLYGVLIPVVSTVPSLIRLYTKALNSD